MSDIKNNLKTKEIYEHTNSDYPLGLYFVKPESSFLSNIPWHWHDELEIDIVREGSAEYYIGEDILSVQSGNAILIKSNVFHTIRAKDDGCTIISLIFSPSILFVCSDSSIGNTYLNTLDSYTDKAILFDKSDKNGRAVISYLEDIIELNLNKSFGYELLTKSALCQLWFLLIKDLPHSEQIEKKESKETRLSLDEERIKDALSFIQENYADNISLDDIATSIHISKSECCRLFKRVINTTPFEYLMRYRILSACDIMIQSQRNDESISYLAGSVGFNSASYFNKLFKEYIGCTPSEFKKNSKTERRDKLSPFGMSFSHI